jgi:hypothetical protein
MRTAIFALIVSIIAAPVLAQAPAQPTTTQPAVGIVEAPAPMIRAIEEMLSPETRREITQRATGGNTVYGVLETILLNNLQILDARGLGSRIIAIDFSREVMVASIANEAPKVFRFDRRTLAISNP